MIPKRGREGKRRVDKTRQNETRKQRKGGNKGGKDRRGGNGREVVGEEEK